MPKWLMGPTKFIGRRPSCRYPVRALGAMSPILLRLSTVRGGQLIGTKARFVSRLTGNGVPMDNHLERRASIQSIDRAAAILRLLASGPRQHGVSELADRLGLARPTVHGLLQTLLSNGFVEKDRHSDKYQLGTSMLQFGYSYLDRNELRSRSIGHADHLANRTGMAVRVVVRHEASAVVIHHILRPAATFQILEIGLQLPLHASAVGKAILAFLPVSESRDFLAGSQPRLTKHTATAASLRAEIEVIRESALATERDEAVPGESSLAAPIFDHAGNVIGAIGIVDATEVIFPRGIAKGRAAAVLEAARGISRELGATHWPPPT